MKREEWEYKLCRFFRDLKIWQVFLSKEQQTCKYYASYFILTSFLRSNKDLRVLQVYDREHDGEKEWERSEWNHSNIIYICIIMYVYILIIVNTYYLEWKKIWKLVTCMFRDSNPFFSLSFSLFHIHISFSVWSFKSCDCSCQKILHERKNYCFSSFSFPRVFFFSYPFHSFIFLSVFLP